MTKPTHGPPPNSVPGIQDYTRLAGDYDSTRYVQAIHVRHEDSRRRVLEGLLPAAVRVAADVACGTGRGLSILQKRAGVLIGIDGTLAMLEVARQKHATTNTRLVQANAGKLPFADGVFDLITCLNFVHLFDKVDTKAAFVSEMGRVLAPGGLLIVEFDNALQGLVLGAIRKYAGRDIGYDWPWHMHASFKLDGLRIVRVAGANLPGLWRVPGLRHMDRYTDRFPLNYLANRIFIAATRS